MTIVEKAYAFAEKAHEGQKDPFGGEQIAHVSAVAEMLDDDEKKAVALLHDVLKMTNTTYEQLFGEFGERVADAVRELTRGPYEPMDAYIRRVKLHPIAREVKVAELHREMDLSRLEKVTDKDLRERDQRFRLIYQLTV